MIWHSPINQTLISQSMASLQRPSQSSNQATKSLKTVHSTLSRRSSLWSARTLNSPVLSSNTCKSKTALPQLRMRSSSSCSPLCSTTISSTTLQNLMTATCNTSTSSKLSTSSSSRRWRPWTSRIQVSWLWITFRVSCSQVSLGRSIVKATYDLYTREFSAR